MLKKRCAEEMTSVALMRRIEVSAACSIATARNCTAKVVRPAPHDELNPFENHGWLARIAGFKGWEGRRFGRAMSEWQHTINEAAWRRTPSR